jgi:TatD DNase family protein
MRIDAHTHLDQYAPQELDAALAELDALDILAVAVAMDPASYARTLAIAERSPRVLPCFGVHPWEAHRFADDLLALQPLMAASPMLGEIGLDYVWDENPAHYPAQRAVFGAFLEHAAATDKLVNLHTKGAEHDVLELLKRYAVRRAIVHWYSGPRDAFDALVAHGCWFTFGVETPRNPSIQALARAVPLDRILTETDGPEGLRWLTGATGMPRHLADVLQVLAELRGLSVAELELVIAANWRALAAGDAQLEARRRV